MSRTDAILKRLLGLHPKLIDLNLDRLLRLLEEMGRPQDRLPPVIHVAGTNGKGSTIAYLRAFLEAAGKRVHVYTSPHLVHFNERVRLAGTLVSTHRLNAMLRSVEDINAGKPITFFEITTAAAFQLFADTPADFLLLEVGMGGEFDATNVVEHPLATVITPIAVDHVQFLGRTIGEIAVAKAGILKRGSPAIFGLQSPDGLKVLNATARRLGVSPFVAGEDFHGHAEDGRLVYQDEAGLLDLPLPRLIGPHQIDNAALAIAVARHARLPVGETDMAAGLRSVEWPARLAPLQGKLRGLLPDGDELWLDGGHNAHGSAALAKALEEMNRTRPMKLALIVGMMNTRPAEDFFAAFKAFDPDVFGLTISGEANSYSAAHVRDAARSLGFRATACRSVGTALRAAAELGEARVVIVGSLYLAGDVLARNGTPPR